MEAKMKWKDWLGVFNNLQVSAEELRFPDQSNIEGLGLEGAMQNRCQVGKNGIDEINVVTVTLLPYTVPTA